MKALIIEAIIVGLIVIVIGCIISHFLGRSCDQKQIITLFLTGVITHVLCEITGANKWYCKNGHACQS